MLWYKAWLETRWRFLIGLALLSLSAAGTVMTYSYVVKVIAQVPQRDLDGPLGSQIAEAIELSRSYRGHVWRQAFFQNLPQMLALFAALLGTGGLLHQANGGGALFTLSLPVTRERLAGVRAATALLEPDSVVSLAGGVIRLELAHNPGAMLSLGADLPDALRIPVLLVLVPLALLLAAFRIVRSPSSRTLSFLALALLAGGGLSNWLDRLVHDGIVIDFVSLGIGEIRTGIFNVADVAVVLGALLLVAARPARR